MSNKTLEVPQKYFALFMEAIGENNFWEDFFVFLKSRETHEQNSLIAKIDDKLQTFVLEELEKTTPPTPDRAMLAEQKVELTAQYIMKIAPLIEQTAQTDKQKALENRNLIKSLAWDAGGSMLTDQNAGVPMPLPEKPCNDNTMIFQLPNPHDAKIILRDVVALIEGRKSRRKFLDRPITLAQLSFLLWATQGNRENSQLRRTLKTVPSAGARHPFETYVLSLKIDGLPQGVWRYLPQKHALVLESEIHNLAELATHAALGQRFVGESAAVLIWAALPYRTEWRYGSRSAKVILLDAGHICQNLYIACEALNLGTCAIAAYSQKNFDELLQLDGQNEFVTYLAPVGYYSA